MRIKIIIILVSSFFCFAQGGLLAEVEGAGEIEEFKKNDRVLILAPHPDDETIGCAGIIQKAVKAGAQVEVVYLTNGDSNQLAFIVYEKRLTFRKAEFIHMGQVRRQEAINAMKLLGLDENKLIFLGYPDFGTFSIFTRYWQAQRPYRSILTRVSRVPYKNDLSFGSPYTGESILSDLEKIILGYKPTKIFCSHPADVNVDHKSLYLFLQIALRDLRKQIPRPKVYPYLIHYLGWPKPRHYHPELDLEAPDSLADSRIKWLKLSLTPQELELKHQAVLCYKSQTKTSAFYLLSFARKNELFGDYPDIELTGKDSLEEMVGSFLDFFKMSTDLRRQGLFTNESLIEGQKEVSYSIEDGCLRIRVGKDKELVRRFSLILYIFGFNDKSPFASMPKIRIVTRHEAIKIYDGKKIIKPAGIRLSLAPDDLVLRIPLNILGDPDFILISVKAYGGKLPSSATGFRKIVIKDKGGK